MTEPLRVALFAMLPRTNAATRAFCERPSVHFGDDVEAHVLTPSGVRLYAALAERRGRARRLAGGVYWYGIVLPRRLAQIAFALRCDVIFIQRGLLRYRSYPLLEWIVWLLSRPLRRAVVYHCDDANWSVVPERRCRGRFRAADVVVTGNGQVAEFAREGGAVVCVIEGAVEHERYARRIHGARRPIVLGWVGTDPEQLLPIVPALADVCRTSDAVVRVVSGRPLDAPALAGRLEFLPWTLEREFELFSDFDIGLLPLADTVFDRGREAYKAKEYMAAGVPVVASNVGHAPTVVEHGEAGYLVDSLDEWKAALSELANNAPLRARLGAAGRRSVEARWTTRRYAGEILDLFNRTASLRSTRATSAVELGP